MYLNSRGLYGVKIEEDCYSAEFSRVEGNVDLAKLCGSKYLLATI